MVRRLFIILQHSWSRSTDTYVFSRIPRWTLQAFSTLKPSFSRDTSWTGLPTRADVPLTGGESQEGDHDFQKKKKIIWLPWSSKHNFSNVKSTWCMYTSNTLLLSTLLKLVLSAVKQLSSLATYKCNYLLLLRSLTWSPFRPGGPSLPVGPSRPWCVKASISSVNYSAIVGKS